MLINTSHIKGLVLRAVDGDIGTAEQIYFDDESWTIRYLTVDTGGWLGGRLVLVSPFSINGVDWQAKRIDVSLTREQVKNSPDVNTHQPVSRQHEAEYLGYFGYPNYWGGPFAWGPAYYPMGFVGLDKETAEQLSIRSKKESPDSHLRSNKGVAGYDIQALDGEIGHVSGFVMDDKSWSIRYMEVGTRNWWPGKKVLISPAWIKRMSWINSKVYISLTREAIQNGPQYTDGMPITRDYENRLYYHYGLPPYWAGEEEPSYPLSLTNV